MSVRLFHFTSKANARAVLAHGFKGTTCWLSPSIETVSGDSNRSALLAVQLDLTESELQAFEQTVVDDVWDEAAGEFVPATDTPPYDWYEIPTQVITRGTVRLVSEEERARLMLGNNDLE